MLFSVRQVDYRPDLHSKAISRGMPITECKNNIYMAFVDLTKAFDTVSRDGLWKIISKFGCPFRLLVMDRLFHDGMKTRVQNNGALFEPFQVTNGVKQDCDGTITALPFLWKPFRIVILDFSRFTYFCCKWICFF